jgi:hypothetical protein
MAIVKAINTIGTAVQHGKSSVTITLQKKYMNGTNLIHSSHVVMLTSIDSIFVAHASAAAADAQDSAILQVVQNASDRWT